MEYKPYLTNLQLIRYNEVVGFCNRQYIEKNNDDTQLSEIEYFVKKKGLIFMKMYELEKTIRRILNSILLFVSGIIIKDYLIPLISEFLK